MNSFYNQFGLTRRGYETEETYASDQADFAESCNTPAASAALQAALNFISAYHTPNELVVFGIKKHPKGTVVLDGNGNVIKTGNGEGKKLTIGRRLVVYFRLPINIPSLGLEGGRFIGFVGDVKVLNATVGTNSYFLCEPYDDKVSNLIGVVNKTTGIAEMDIGKVCEAIQNVMDKNNAKRGAPHRKNRRLRKRDSCGMNGGVVEVIGCDTKTRTGEMEEKEVIPSPDGENEPLNLTSSENAVPDQVVPIDDDLVIGMDGEIGDYDDGGGEPLDSSDLFPFNSFYSDDLSYPVDILTGYQIDCYDLGYDNQQENNGTLL